MGMGYSLNRGISEAVFDYIAYLPSDDYYFEEHLNSLKTTFENTHDAVLVFSGVRYEISDSLIQLHDTESFGIKKGHSLQLVQTLHRKTNDRWIERREFVSEDLFILFWKKLINKGVFNQTKQITCYWTLHPFQRHRIISEKFGGGLNQYRSYYNVKQPIKLRMSNYKLIDEEKQYASFRKLHKKNENSLKILIIGELAYNSERVYALEEAGHTLYGLWIPRPNYSFNTVGPLPFGNVIDIPFDNWEEKIKEIQPDIIYALLNSVAVSLAYDVLLKFSNIPFVWHFKEGPSVCLKLALWEKLIYLYAHADGIIYLNEIAKKWYEQFIPQGGLSFILDGDLPKQDYFSKNFSKKLSSEDGEIHTLVAGRMIGISPQDMSFLAHKNIHIHLYTENYHSQKEIKNSQLKKVAPYHFHIHPHCGHPDWVKELSQYDAGWLHCFNSVNYGSIMYASWDDLNIPARINTYAAAGLPVIQKDNQKHLVAMQKIIKDIDAGIFYVDFIDLVEKLRDSKGMEKYRKNMVKNRMIFSFDYHVDHLISFFKNVIKHKISK
jgi:hypothetical protein